VLIAGIVTALRVQAGKRGKTAFVTLDDGGGSVEILVYNDAFDTARALLREDQLVLADVKVQQRMSDDGQLSGLRIIAENVYGLAAIRKRLAKGLRIACNGSAQADRLFELLAPYRNGTCPIVVEYGNHGVVGELLLGDDWRVALDEPLLSGLAEWLPQGSVRVIY
jgi:DNA polymerase-3 subunit alpha